MRLLVFGASGTPGRELVHQALERGHAVDAFVRRAAAMTTQPGLNVVQGDVADFSLVSAAMSRQDAVVSVLGVAEPLKHDPAVIAGIENIVRAMEATGLRRLLYLSFVGVRESRAAVCFVLRYLHSNLGTHSDPIAC